MRCAAACIYLLFVSSIAKCDPPQTRSDIERSLERQAQVKQAVKRIASATVAFRDRTGSGVIVSRDGHVLTAGHIVLASQGDAVTLVLADGRTVSARWLGVNYAADTGMLKIVDSGDWPFAELADAAPPERGDWCVCLGHPGGYTSLRPFPVVKVGRVRHINSARIVTDCAIRSGDSGGPLCDLSGRVIGIHSQVSSCVADNWHIPVARFRAEWKELIAGQQWGLTTGRSSVPEHRWLLGIGLRDDTGLLARVGEIDKGSPADAAGLLKDDVIVSWQGETLTHRQHLIDLIEDHKPGDRVRLVAQRGSRNMELNAILRTEAQPDPPRTGAGPAIAWTEADTRARRPGLNETQSEDHLRVYKALAKKCRECVVSVLVDKRPVALGTVITGDGYIVTNASGLKEQSSVSCVLSNGKEVPVTVIGSADDHDLALIFAPGLTTHTTPLAASGAEVGTIVFTPDQQGRVLHAGVVGALPRSLALQGYLGVSIGPHSSGVEVQSVSTKSTAEAAGLQAGDVIVSLGNTLVIDGGSLSKAIGTIEPGRNVRIEFMRDGERRSAEAVLRRLTIPDWFVPQEIKLGAVPSRRLAGFPRVLQHDSPMLPEQCGGPLLTLDGEIAAVNIARRGRGESFAIPIDEVQKTVQRLRNKRPAGDPKD